MAIITVLKDELLVLGMVVLWTLRLVVLVGDGLTITSNSLFSCWCIVYVSLQSWDYCFTLVLVAFTH